MEKQILELNKQISCLKSDIQQKKIILKDKQHQLDTILNQFNENEKEQELIKREQEVIRREQQLCRREQLLNKENQKEEENNQKYYEKIEIETWITHTRFSFRINNDHYFTFNLKNFESDLSSYLNINEKILYFLNLILKNFSKKYLIEYYTNPHLTQIFNNYDNTTQNERFLINNLKKSGHKILFLLNKTKPDQKLIDLSNNSLIDNLNQTVITSKNFKLNKF